MFDSNLTFVPRKFAHDKARCGINCESLFFPWSTLVDSHVEGIGSDKYRSILKLKCRAQVLGALKHIV